MLLIHPRTNDFEFLIVVRVYTWMRHQITPLFIHFTLPLILSIQSFFMILYESFSTAQARDEHSLCTSLSNNRWRLDEQETLHVMEWSKTHTWANIIYSWTIIRGWICEHCKTNRIITCNYWGNQLGPNWFFQFDLVASLFGGQDSLLSRVVYALVGLSGLYAISILFDSESETASSSAGTLQYGTEFSEEDDFTALEEERPDDDFDLR